MNWSVDMTRARALRVARSKAVTTPSKTLVWFEESGHEPFGDEPAKLNAIAIRVVTCIYVHTPERFEFCQVAVGQTFGNLVQVTSGLHDGERVVVLGQGVADNEASSMDESDGRASASLNGIFCDNQRGPAEDDRDRDDHDKPQERVARHEVPLVQDLVCLLIE